MADEDNKVVEGAQTEEEKLWSEMEAKDKGAGGELSPSADPKNADDFTEAENRGNDAAPAGATQQAPAAAQTPSAAQAETPRPELDWSTVPPEFRAAHEAIETDRARLERLSRRHAGRVSAMQERFNRLQAEAAAGKGAAHPRQKLADTAVEALSDIPEIVTPLKTFASAVDAEVDKLERANTERSERENAELVEYVKEQEEALTSAHPDWEKVLDDNGPRFLDWIKDQPWELRKAFLDNQNKVFDAQGGAKMIGAFKEFLAKDSNPPQPARPAAQQQDPPNARRQSQRSATASPGGGNRQPTLSGIPRDGDPAAIWNAMAATDPDEQRERRRA